MTSAMRECLACIRKITSRPIEVKGRTVVKVPKLPPADDTVRHKVRVHIACVFMGALIAVLISYVPIDTLMGHWLPVLPTLPNMAFEAIDRLNNR